MIAPVNSTDYRDTDNAWHDQFLKMMSTIRRHASVAFRHLKSEARDEAIAEIVASAFVAFLRLAELDKLSIAYPTVLARYGVAQYHDGRRVGTETNTRDVSSPAARRKHGITVESLDAQNDDDHRWQAAAVEDRTSGPAEVATFRIDFDAWLHSLTRRDRRLASDLSIGETTSAAAKKHCVSPGRISQIRRELAEAWEQFHGEVEGTKCETCYAT